MPLFPPGPLLIFIVVIFITMMPQTPGFSIHPDGSVRDMLIPITSPDTGNPSPDLGGRPSAGTLYKKGEISPELQTGDGGPGWN